MQTEYHNLAEGQLMVVGRFKNRVYTKVLVIPKEVIEGKIKVDKLKCAFDFLGDSMRKIINSVYANKI